MALKLPPCSLFIRRKHNAEAERHLYSYRNGLRPRSVPPAIFTPDKYNVEIIHQISSPLYMLPLQPFIFLFLRTILDSISVSPGSRGVPAVVDFRLELPKKRPSSHDFAYGFLVRPGPLYSIADTIGKSNENYSTSPAVLIPQHGNDCTSGRMLALPFW